jgi:SAM-dependent methyltransferase
VGDNDGASGRESLRRTFDEAAATYERYRPSYPETLYDDLISLTGLEAGSRLLEVGCGPGVATRPFAARGFAVTCVELGAELAVAARRALAGYDVEVVTAAFEEWTPSRLFDLVYSATAWHWIDPAVKYQHAWQALRPGGHLAFWEAVHVLPDGGDPFFAEIQEVYDSIGEGMPPGTVGPRPGELPENLDEITASGLFDVVAVRHYDWATVYTAEDYIGLLNTFSGHIAMADWQRDRLYSEIRRRLGNRPAGPGYPAGSVRRHWGGVLRVARRRGLRSDLAQEGGV